MHWFQSSLNRKFALGTASGLVASSLVFLVLFIGFYRHELAQQRTEAASQVTRLLRTSLENAMLKRDLDGLRTILIRLGEQPGIDSVMIVNPKREVRFASDPILLGRRLDDLVFGDRPETLFLTRASGAETLRSVHPVHNRRPCQPCHGPIAKHPINGVLLVDFDAAPIRARARHTTLLLMGAGALIVLINLAGGWWFIHRYVVRPVERLGETAARFAEGDLEARARLPGNDELATLGRTFDTMAKRVQWQMRILEEKEHFLQALVDAIPDGIRIIAPDHRVLLANRTYREQLGVDTAQALTTPCHTLTHGLDSPCPTTLVTCPLEQVLKNGTSLRTIHRHRRTDGRPLDVEIYAAPMHVTQEGRERRLVVEAIRDLEQEIRFSHEQKLSELGRLAAGVAHEIHNPLASVRLALHGCQQRLAQGETEAVLEHLELVDREVDACIEVTQRLLKLSLSPSERQELVDVGACLDDTLKLLQWEADQQAVRIRLDLKDRPLRILAHDNDLRMIALNLIQNALHAMPEGGTLKVRAYSDHGWVRIEFADTGHGIPEDDLPHIFAPFFSRRADGVRGTGLGLAITRSLVEAHDGRIEVESLVDQGACFRIQFPDPDRSAS